MKTRITTALLLLVLALLVYSVVHVSVGHGRHPMLSVTRVSIANINAALALHKVDCGAYPTVAAGLSSLVTNAGATGWKGPYLRNLPTDAWGQNFAYSLKEGVPDIRAAGPDMKFDTADDITSK